MGETLKFTNKDTNKAIQFDVNKPLVLIFGKNGSGKTTFSREFEDKELVFNTDFIYKNIYVESSSEAKVDTNTKESFSSLWVGEKIVKLKKELNELKQSKDKNKSSLDELIAEVNRLLNEKGVQLFQFDNLNKSIKVEEFKKSKGLTDEEIVKNYLSKLEIKTDVADDNDLKNKIARYRNEVAVKMLNGRISLCPLFKELFLENKEEEKSIIIQKIANYNNSFEELTKINNAFNLKNKAKQREWIKEAIELHKDADKCSFCGGENVTEAINHWKPIISSKVNEQRDNLIKYIDGIISSANDILKDKEQLIKLTKNIIEGIEAIGLYFTNVKEFVSKDVKVNEDLVFPEVKTDEIAVANNELLVSIQNYIFRPFLSKYEILYLLFKDYEVAEKKKDDEFVAALKSDSERIKDSINSYLSELGFDKEIKIVIDKRGNDRKYRFDFENSSTKIATLSDGQKHKLALAIFLASLEGKDLKDKTIVLDDPVVTLDYRAYHSVRNQICRLTKKPDLKRTIVMTCNISYLYIQLSNLFGTLMMDNVELFHLYSGGIESVDPEIINYDDLTLYKKGLESIANEKDFCQVAMLNTRIYRMFLDLYLRIKGIPSNGNPSDEIQLLPDLNNSDKIRLNVLNRDIVGNCRDKNATNKQLFEAFKYTNEFVKILHFPDLLTDEEINKLVVYFNDNRRDDKCDSDSLLFDIIVRANSILQTENEKYVSIKNYMNHPRTQLTSSIVGVDFSDLELEEISQE